MRDFQLPGRSEVMSTNGMVATSQPMATQAGLEILRLGGNAMDAAIAAGAVLCVTEPMSTGIGGDCFILYHEAGSGRLHGLNGSGRAPAGASAGEYRRRGLESVPGRGILSVTVPGAVDGWCRAMERFGTMELEQVLGPAITLARQGYAVTPVVAYKWKRAESLLAASEHAGEALLAGGRAPGVGSRHHQPALAQSLRLIAEGGRDSFYTGPIAAEIVRFSKEQGGLLELEDLAGHQGEWVEPIHIDYRGIQLYEIPPNGQGITALMALNILENNAPGGWERLGAEHLHIMAEAHSLAAAERDRFVSDPAFSSLPVERMLSKSFAKEQFGRINPKRALEHPMKSALGAGGDTVYLTVVDRERNAVSYINSLYDSFGSGLVAGKTGIVLQNRGAGFVLEEGHLNCLAPHKRPLHTIIPAMACRDGRPVLSFGVMGGFYQPMGHAYLLTNWLDFGMDLQEAIDAPRFLPVNGELTVERGVPQTTRRALAQMGHRVLQAEEPLGGAQAIGIDWEEGLLRAGSDPRKDGCALGY